MPECAPLRFAPESPLGLWDLQIELPELGFRTIRSGVLPDRQYAQKIANLLGVNVQYQSATSRPRPENIGG